LPTEAAKPFFAFIAFIKAGEMVLIFDAPTCSSACGSVLILVEVVGAGIPAPVSGFRNY
jgi:hypothetical protein